MYSYKLKYKGSKDFEGNAVEKTVLKAKFRFYKETAPIARAKIRKRIECGFGRPLNNYLKG